MTHLRMAFGMSFLALVNGMFAMSGHEPWWARAIQVVALMLCSASAAAHLVAWKLAAHPQETPHE